MKYRVLKHKNKFKIKIIKINKNLKNRTQKIYKIKFKNKNKNIIKRQQIYNMLINWILRQFLQKQNQNQKKQIIILENKIENFKK